MRVKLLVLPFEERLCILCKKGSTIGDLKANVLHAIQFYSIYKQFLVYCSIHLEIKIDGTTYGVPEGYILQECVTPNDTIVVSFVDQHSVQNRQGIHLRAQTPSTIQYRSMMSQSPNPMNQVNPSPPNPMGVPSQNRSPEIVDPYSVQNTVQHQNQRNWGGPRYNMPRGPRPDRQEQKLDDNEFVEKTREFDVSTVDIEEIKRWTQMYMASSTAQPSYHCPFSQLVDRLSGKFPKLRAVNDWESFLIQHCLLSVAKTADGQVVQCEAVKKEKRRNKKKEKKSKQNSSKPERSPNAQSQSNEMPSSGGGARKNANQSNGPSSTLHPVLQNLPPPKRSPPSVPKQAPKPNVNQHSVDPNTKTNEPSYVNAAKKPVENSRVPNVQRLRPVDSLKQTEPVAKDTTNAVNTANTSNLANTANSTNNTSGHSLISKPPLRANPVVIGHVNFMNSKKKAAKEEVELPTTPESPTDDEMSSVPTSAYPTPNVTHKKLSHTPSPITKLTIEEKTSETLSEVNIDELKAPEVTPNATTHDSKDNGLEIEREDENGMNDAISETTENVNMTPDQSSVLFVQDHLREMLVKSYIVLGTPQCRYVVLHELEREMKSLFRDTTPHELDPTDLNYVNFMQLLMVESGKWDTISLEIVHCDRRLICLKRGEEYVPKTTRIKKHGREYDPCPEIETYVLIEDRKGDDKGNTVKDTEDSKDLENLENPTDSKGGDGGGSGGDDDDDAEDAVGKKRDDENGDGVDDKHDGDHGDGNGDGDTANGGDESKSERAKGTVNGKANDHRDDDQNLDERIRQSIAHLARCNVVRRMDATDIYWHLKLIHSECGIRILEAEYNGHHGRLPMHNSFDEIATEMLRDGIDGPKILEMKWSDWERMHDLYRFDRDHQDFVDELVEDFFFPFLTAESLSNELAVSGKNKFQRHCMFDSERVRPKLTLCVDYALFAPEMPILHYLVKLADYEDCERLLRLHTHLSVDEVMGEYSAMHIASWRGKFKLLSAMTRYGGDPLKVNAQGETALEAGAKHERKLEWYRSQFPQFQTK